MKFDTLGCGLVGPVKIWIDRVELGEVVDFKVDRDAGEITFLRSPEEVVEDMRNLMQAMRAPTVPVVVDVLSVEAVRALRRSLLEPPRLQTAPESPRRREAQWKRERRGFRR